MQGFLEKMRAAIRQAMQGRNGADELGLSTLVLAVAASLLATLLRSGLLQLVSFGAYIYTIWRMFSRDTGKRRAENVRWLEKTAGLRKQGRAFLLRQKNRKDYKYFKCPQCHALIRLRRGTGEVDLTCPRCKHQFKQKA